MTTLSIVIPAKNEAENIIALVEAIDRALQVHAPIEIIVVDDGSTDNSVAVLSARRETMPHLRIVRHNRSGGQSAAVHSGVLAASPPPGGGGVALLLWGWGGRPPPASPGRGGGRGSPRRKNCRNWPPPCWPIPRAASVWWRGSGSGDRIRGRRSSPRALRTVCAAGSCRMAPAIPAAG